MAASLRQSDSRSCTSSLQRIPGPWKPGKLLSLQHLYEGVLPWSPLSLSISWCWSPFYGYASSPRCVAQRPCRRLSDDTPIYVPITQAPPRAETLCGPHSQSALRRRCARRCPRPHALTPPPRIVMTEGAVVRATLPFLSESGLPVPGLGRLGHFSAPTAILKGGAGANGCASSVAATFWRPSVQSSRQAGGTRADGAGDRLFGRRLGYPGYGAVFEVDPHTVL